MIIDVQTDGWKDRRKIGGERYILVKVIVICKDENDATIKTVIKRTPTLFL